MGAGNLLTRASAFVSEWTPLALLVSYLVFSFFFYILIPSRANSILWYIYISVQTAVVLMVLSEALAAIRPSVLSRRTRRKAAKEGFPDLDGEKNMHKCPKIDLVLVAYLPNEKDIILRQMRYALTQIDYPHEKLNINVVYNTPEPIEPLETEMNDMTHQFSNLRVVSVPGSTSKADNINYFLTQPYAAEADIIAIFDTDHYPSRTALKWVARAFNKGDVDVIQGRCCIYNYSESWLTRLIAAEFDQIYGVFHPGRAAAQKFGLFGGSNGYWNASLLRSLGMQKHMLTEDIDSTLRAISSGARIKYMLEVVSYETAPATIQALLKQRLRWAQGWTQVTIRHAWPGLRYGAAGTRYRSRAGLFFLLVIRELYFYLLSQITLLLIANLATAPPSSFSEAYRKFIGFKISVWMLVLNLLCIVVSTCITMRNRSEFSTKRAIFVFGALSPIYYTGLTLASIFSHFRELNGYKSWNPTARSVKAPRVLGA